MKFRTQIHNPGLIGAIFGYRCPLTREWQSREQIIALGHSDRKTLTPVCQWPLEWLTPDERVEFLPPAANRKGKGSRHAHAS